MTMVDDILTYWFGPTSDEPLERSDIWWKKDPEIDREIRQRFERVYWQVADGEREEWRERPRSCLAYVIVLDQFARNMFRDTPQMFAEDHRALAATREGRQGGLDQKLPPIQRSFFYMPLMHSEDIDIQKESLEAFDQLRSDAPDALADALESNYEFAVKHHDIIERFGRYPHRNEILGRASTDEEEAFLRQPGSSF